MLMLVRQKEASVFVCFVSKRIVDIVDAICEVTACKMSKLMPA